MEGITPARQEAQIDFGTGAWVEMPDGKRRRPWVFRIVLSHSRKAYSEVREFEKPRVRCRRPFRFRNL